MLQALSIPVDSQLLVFSKTGLQGALTSPSNPRALFFNDRVVLGYVRGAPLLELIAHDARQGAIFYTLDQAAQDAPVFKRRNSCLTCHLSRNSMDVPGMLVRSQFTSPSGASLRQLGQFLIDHRSPFDQRWGGYYSSSDRRAIVEILRSQSRTAAVLSGFYCFQWRMDREPQGLALRTNVVAGGD